MICSPCPDHKSADFKCQKMATGAGQTAFRPHLDRIQTASRPHPDRIQTASRLHPDRIQTASRQHPDHIQTTSRPHPDQTILTKTIQKAERRRCEGQCLPDVRRSIIPPFCIFTVFLVFLERLVYCVVSITLRVQCYLHLRWYFFKMSKACMGNG